MHNFFFLKAEVAEFPLFPIQRKTRSNDRYCLYIFICELNLPISQLILKLNNTLIYAFISVHNLTPGDIKVVAGVGDSITVRNGTPHAEKSFVSIDAF